jgi:glutaminyl-tRNA synthetase
MATAAIGTRWQLERIGYFIVDQDTRAGAPVLNRIIGLRDPWAEAKPAAQPEPPVDKPENARAKTRPKGKSPAEYRIEARARDPELAAAYASALALGLTAEQADLIAGDTTTARLFLAASGPGRAPAVARWIINELPRALGDRELADVTIDPAHLATLVELAESGTQPRAIAAERGLDAVADAGELSILVDDVIGKHPDKVAQYRGGKTGLLGFFVGQVVKASGGKANPEAVKRLLSAQLEPR